MPKDINLKKKAADLRNEAEQERKELEDRVSRQLSDELEEDETKLSPEEIQERRKAIQSKIAEAKEAQGVGTLSDLAEKAEESGEDMNPVARQILREAGYSAGVKTEERESPFPTMYEFIKTLRAQAGGYDYQPSKEEQAKLEQLARGARTIENNQKWEEKSLGDEEIQELWEEKTITGASGGGANALVPTEHMEELLRTMAENQVFINRARRVPMAQRSIAFPRLAQTDANDTRPLFGFAAISKVGEGSTKPTREPDFEQFTLSAVKYAAYLEASDELLNDSIIDTQPVLVQLLSDAISYEYDRDGMRGSGSSEPQGFIGSNAEWVQNRENANQVTINDLFGLEERHFGDGVYYHHPSVIPDLYGLNSGNVIVFNPDLSTEAPGTLLGRELVKTHKLPTLGSKGDLCLVDPSFYVSGQIQAMTVDSSRHYQFASDVTAFRAVFRAAGEPWPAGLFSTESDGSNMTFRVSPFAVLGATASS